MIDTLRKIKNTNYINIANFSILWDKLNKACKIIFDRNDASKNGTYVGFDLTYSTMGYFEIYYQNLQQIGRIQYDIVELYEVIEVFNNESLGIE